ncbi:hypothetical protein RN69_30205 [Bradyrhizobium japonicum]|nr:hypothetical protein RN69_30205 [Bradyrhizobium japonicum]KMJ98241.1 hypothetical protein CF64_18370 [Bradyrhizobium japonicum]
MLDDQSQPAMKGLQCPACDPGVSLRFGGECATDDDGVHWSSEPSLSQMEKLQIGGESRIIRADGERARAVAGEQVFEDRDRLDHDHLAVLQRRDKAGGVDRKKIGIILDSEQIDRAQPISHSQFLEQPNDTEPTTFAIDGEHD